jgi:hypothetical protein
MTKLYLIVAVLQMREKPAIRTDFAGAKVRQGIWERRLFCRPRALFVSSRAEPSSALQC